MQLRHPLKSDDLYPFFFEQYIKHIATFLTEHHSPEKIWCLLCEKNIQQKNTTFLSDGFTRQISNYFLLNQQYITQSHEIIKHSNSLFTLFNAYFNDMPFQPRGKMAAQISAFLTIFPDYAKQLRIDILNQIHYKPYIPWHDQSLSQETLNHFIQIIKTSDIEKQTEALFILIYNAKFINCSDQIKFANLFKEILTQTTFEEISHRDIALLILCNLFFPKEQHDWWVDFLISAIIKNKRSREIIIFYIGACIGSLPLRTDLEDKLYHVMEKHITLTTHLKNLTEPMLQKITQLLPKNHLAECITRLIDELNNNENQALFNTADLLLKFIPFISTPQKEKIVDTILLHVSPNNFSNLNELINNSPNLSVDDNDYEFYYINPLKLIDLAQHCNPSEKSDKLLKIFQNATLNHILPLLNNYSHLHKKTIIHVGQSIKNSDEKNKFINQLILFNETHKKYDEIIAEIILNIHAKQLPIQEETIKINLENWLKKIDPAYNQLPTILLLPCLTDSFTETVSQHFPHWFIDWHTLIFIEKAIPFLNFENGKSLLNMLIKQYSELKTPIRYFTICKAISICEQLIIKTKPNDNHSLINFLIDCLQNKMLTHEAINAINACHYLTEKISNIQREKICDILFEIINKNKNDDTTTQLNAIKTFLIFSQPLNSNQQKNFFEITMPSFLKIEGKFLHEKEWLENIFNSQKINNNKLFLKIIENELNTKSISTLITKTIFILGILPEKNKNDFLYGDLLNFYYTNKHLQDNMYIKKLHDLLITLHSQNNQKHAPSHESIVSLLYNREEQIEPGSRLFWRILGYIPPTLHPQNTQIEHKEENVMFSKTFSH